MLLYTCPARTHGADAPVIKHPCGVAAKALREAGHTFDVEAVGGFKALPPTRWGRRGKIRRLTGQEDVPVLVAGDEVISGHREIVAWAKANPAA